MIVDDVFGLRDKSNFYSSFYLSNYLLREGSSDNGNDC